MRVWQVVDGGVASTRWRAGAPARNTTVTGRILVKAVNASSHATLVQSENQEPLIRVTSVLLGLKYQVKKRVFVLIVSTPMS